MKRHGLKTKGIYFIPFVGGAAVAESAFPSRKAEMVIAIMGSIWGFACAIATGLVYLFTNNPTFAAASAWIAMSNLFNLLPINPLDGGRIFKSVAFSIHSRLGLGFLGIGVVASIFLAFYPKIGLFGLLFIVGTVDLIFEFKRSTGWLEKSIVRLRKKQPLAEIAYQAWKADYAALKQRVERNEVDVCSIDLVAMCKDERYWRADNLNWEIFYREKELEVLRNSPGMPVLDRRGIAMSTAGYFMLAGLLWGLMFYMNHVPGAQLAMKVLAW